MNEIKIRKATLDDVEAISTIKVEGWQSAYKNIISDEYLNNMSIQRTIEKNTKNFDRYPFIVAEHDNEVVGFCGYDFGNIEELDNNADCELRGIYVKPDMKRNGIGRKLINYVKKEFLKANKEQMILWCLKENYPSRKFYESMGGVAGKCKTSEFGGKEYEIISYLFNLESELELVFPTKEMQKEIEEYMQEFYNNGDDVAGIGGLNRIKDFDVWLDKVEKDRLPITCESERVPASLYFSVRKIDKKIVGNLQIRHLLNEKLLKYGGHIGDSVRPSERMKGYATEQIRLALLKCKEFGIDRVLMDCDKNNIGSAKAIKNNGGILENEIYVEEELVQRYWISLKKKFVTNPQTMSIVTKGNYTIKNINNNDFNGDIALINFEKLEEPYVVKDINLCMANDNYKWLEFYDCNSKIRLTAMYDNNDKIVEWYFDIAKEIGKENGIPYEDDLYLDVVVNQNGEIILLDENELKEALDRLEISKKDYDMAYNEANILINKLKGNKNKLEEFTNKYLKEMRG